MAALAIGFIGAAIGSSIGGTLIGISAATIGGFIGSTIGGLIDNMLIAGTQKAEGPRLDDLSVTTSTYGAPIPAIFGPQNRLAGNIIWSTGLIETKTTKKKGGKGGEVTTVSEKIVDTPRAVSRITEGGKGGGVKTTTYSYRVSLAIAWGEGVCHRPKKLWGNSKVIFDLSKATVQPEPPTADVGMVVTRTNGTHSTFDTMRFYQGTGTQTKDPTIEAVLGSADTTAYRHTCYSVIKDLQLADFGNAIPNLEVELEAHASISVAQVVKEICRRAGATEVAASSLSAEVLRGYIISRTGTAVSALEPLALAYDFDAAEQRGQIRFVKRGAAMKGVIPIGDMGAVATGNEPPEPIHFETQTSLSLPREAAVTFNDPALDYQPNTQRDRRPAGQSENNLSHELAVTLSATEGRALAQRLLWEAWAARRTATFALTDKWVRLSPADIVGVQAPGGIVPMKLTRATRGVDGVIQVEARHEDPEIYHSTVAGAPGRLPPNDLQLPGPTRFIAMDTSVVRSIDDDTGFYWVAMGPERGWRGADILRSSDDGTTYGLMSSVGIRAVIGDVAVALPGGPADFWDRGNSLTVQLAFADDELESISDIAVLNGNNAAWLGPASGQDGEVIQFATAALIVPGTYVLTDLLRGRRGTDYAIGSHGANEVFVLLEPDTLGRSDFGPGDWFASRLYKPVSVLAAEADTPAQAFANTGEGKRPFSPVHVRGTRDTSNNLTITWVRRSRAMGAGLSAPVPLAEQGEAYEIDVIVAGIVRRTLTATTPTVAYSAASQAADGISPGSPVTVRIYQMSAVRGRGRQTQATV